MRRNFGARLSLRDRFMDRGTSCHLRFKNAEPHFVQEDSVPSISSERRPFSSCCTCGATRKPWWLCKCHDFLGTRGWTPHGVHQEWCGSASLSASWFDSLALLFPQGLCEFVSSVVFSHLGVSTFPWLQITFVGSLQEPITIAWRRVHCSGCVVWWERNKWRRCRRRRLLKKNCLKHPYQ